MRQWGAMRDRNEGPVIARARALGYLCLANSVKGRPDWCWLRNGETFWVEVKAPGEPFTKAQLEEFPRLMRHGVYVYVVESVEDVDAFHAGTLDHWHPESVTGTFSRGRGSRAKAARKHVPGMSAARTVQEQCNGQFCPRSKAPGSLFCTACGKSDAVPPPRKASNPTREHGPQCTRLRCHCPK